jgi:Zn-finger nucleic acid-binding protein
MSERQGIEIDYCPQCRGVWLDRGELDKLIERAATAPVPPPGQVAQPPAAGWTQPAPPPPPPQQQPWGGGQPGYGHGHPGYGHPGYGHHGKRRKSWLEEIFD